MRWSTVFTNIYRVIYQETISKINLNVNLCEFKQHTHNVEMANTQICEGDLAHCKPIYSMKYKEQKDQEEKTKCAEANDPTLLMNLIQKKSYYAIVTYKVIDQLEIVDYEIKNAPKFMGFTRDQIKEAHNEARSKLVAIEIKNTHNKIIAAKFKYEAQSKALEQGAPAADALKFGPDESGYQLLALNWHIPYQVVLLFGENPDVTTMEL